MYLFAKTHRLSFHDQRTGGRRKEVTQEEKQAAGSEIYKVLGGVHRVDSCRPWHFPALIGMQTVAVPPYTHTHPYNRAAKYHFLYGMSASK